MARMLRHMPRPFRPECLTRTAVALMAVLAGAVGCAGPAVEGVLADDAFVIETGSSQRLGTDVDPIFVLFEADDVDATLRTVSIKLPAFASLPRGEVLVVDGVAGGPQVEVIAGALERLDDGNGGELLSSTQERTSAAAVGGQIVIDDTGSDAVAGSFVVDLDDGGYVAGTFASVR